MLPTETLFLESYCKVWNHFTHLDKGDLPIEALNKPTYYNLQQLAKKQLIP